LKCSFSPLSFGAKIQNSKSLLNIAKTKNQPQDANRDVGGENCEKRIAFHHFHQNAAALGKTKNKDIRKLVKEELLFTCMHDDFFILDV